MLTMIDFFKESPTVIWTLEHLKSLMTSEVPCEDEFYELGDAVIAESSDISTRNIFPIVLVKMTLRSDASQHDYLYFIPEKNSMGVWHGPLTYREVTPHEIGRDFYMSLSGGTHVRGKIAMRHKQLCFQFKKDYYAKENHD